MYRRYSANAGVSNMRPVGQKRHARGFNPARLISFAWRKTSCTAWNVLSQNVKIYWMYFSESRHLIRLYAILELKWVWHPPCADASLLSRFRDNLMDLIDRLLGSVQHFFCFFFKQSPYCAQRRCQRLKCTFHDQFSL